MNGVLKCRRELSRPVVSVALGSLVFFAANLFAIYRHVFWCFNPEPDAVACNLQNDNTNTVTNDEHFIPSA